MTHDKNDLQRILSQREGAYARASVTAWFVNSHAIGGEIDAEPLQRIEQIRNAMNEYLKGDFMTVAV